MSCSMTVPAVQARTKTVTRRHIDTWRSLKPGDRLTLIEKGMGLPKGAHQVDLADVEITDVRVEPLSAVTKAECVAEGFPQLNNAQFVVMWLASHGYRPGTPARNVDVRRIQFRYIDPSITRRPAP